MRDNLKINGGSKNIQLIVDTISNDAISKKTVDDFLAERAGLYNENYKKYAGEISWIVKIYLGAVGCIVLLSGTSIHFDKSCFLTMTFNLSDKVLITLLTTTSANVLGLMYIVAKHLFPNNPEKGKKRK